MPCRCPMHSRIIWEAGMSNPYQERKDDILQLTTKEEVYQAAFQEGWDFGIWECTPREHKPWEKTAEVLMHATVVIVLVMVGYIIGKI